MKYLFIILIAVQSAGCALQAGDNEPAVRCEVLFSDPDWVVVELAERDARLANCTPIDYAGDGGNDYWCPADWRAPSSFTGTCPAALAVESSK